MDGLVFTEEELRGTTDEHFSYGYDGECNCNENIFYDVNHIIDVLKQNRENNGRSSK